MNELQESQLSPRNWSEIRRFIVFSICLVSLCVVVSWYYDKVIAPIFIAGFIAYLVNPLVNSMERYKMSRNVATMIILVVILGVLLAVSMRLFPYIYEQLVELVQQVPPLLENFSKNVGKYLRDFLKDHGIKDNGAVDRALKSFSKVDQIMPQFQMAAKSIFNVGAGVMGSILNIVLVPVMTFYLLAEKPRLIQWVRRITPRDLRPYGARVSRVIDETLVNVIRGQLKVATTLALFYSIGFTIIGLADGVAIGIAAGACRVIPYLDVVVGVTLGVTYIFTHNMDPVTVFWLVGVIGVVQLLDGAVVTPKLIGQKVGLHPMIVILTVIASSAKLGFWGVILAIPVAAVIKALYKLMIPIYRESSLFSGRRPPL